MNEKTIKAAFGSLLHDIDSIHYQDRSELENASHLQQDSPAYITYIADHIASATDRKNVENSNDENADTNILLSSIFNIINGRNLTLTHTMSPLTSKINYPEKRLDKPVSDSDYDDIMAKLKNELSTVEFIEEYLNYVLSILERYLSFVPSKHCLKDAVDISLFDHSKITAAIASCISEYLQKEGITDYRTELLQNEEAFLDKKAFIMFSGDFSGIQSYLFNIIPDGALKRLRSRSFFLEILMEHIVDEMLTSCGVSRANLIYSGGGHCYLLLPNTEKVHQVIHDKKKRLNAWLRHNFGTMLYFACAYTECSAKDLMNIPAIEAPYEQIYRELSQKISREKLHRYTAEELMELNETSGEPGSRECKICGTEANLCKEENICHWCDSFGKISSVLLNKELIIVVSENKSLDRPKLTFPGDNGDIYYYFTNETDARELAKAGMVKRIYTKNKPHSDLPYCTNLYMGDYVYDTRFEALVDKEGLNRLAVLRADVDNLGQAFISGFTRKDDDPELRNRYNTFTRTAAFSRQMSMFFKYYLNFILEGKEGNYKLWGHDSSEAGKRVVTVYSGGDDLFLIGNMCDILEAAVMIRSAFDHYTAGALSISFGVGIYSVRYPLYNSAYETAELESMAKQKEGKNSITLFTDKEDHTYRFDEFKESVLGEKYQLLQRFFEYEDEEQERGNAFLYQLLTFLKESRDRINIARYAYVLARLEPKTGNLQYKALYKNFSKQMYEWILNPKDRKELITAIDIYIYLTRKRSDT